MLLSPGHSPREISSPSPSIPPSPSPSTQTQTRTLTTTSTSTSRKRHRAAVLDEDTYVAAIEKIIERDFFPDIPKLRDRLDWLEAVRTGDPVVIRDAQLKILERRASKNQTQTPLDSSRARSTSLFPSESATPFATPSNPNFTGSLNQTLPSHLNSQEGEIDLSLSLDEFLGRYTSEDNESFSKIIEKVNQKKREMYAHLLEGENEKVEAIEYTKQDRITDGYGTSGQPASTLEGWKYTAKNLLMYHPADRGELPLTLEEQAERLKASTKEINRSNTRFHGKSLSGSKPSTEDEAAAILYAPVIGSTPAGPVPRESDKSLKYDLDDLRKTPIAKAFYVESDKKADNGYSFVKTPSPAPGVDESPIMTWGEIEGTPLRLDLDDDASGTPGRANGPQFNIPLPPARDVKAHLLSREAARKIKDRKNKFAPKPPLPSPSRSGSMSPGVRTLSPAAQKFVRNAMAKSSHTIDENLRASYRGATPVANSPRLRSRFSRDISTGLRSPSAQHGTGSPW